MTIKELVLSNKAKGVCPLRHIPKRIKDALMRDACKARGIHR